jgi:hypothetical protein
VLGNGIYVCIRMHQNATLKVAELNTRARVLVLTNVMSGPENPESRSRILCPLDWHWQYISPPASYRVRLITLAASPNSASRHACLSTKSLTLLPYSLFVCHFLTFIHFHSLFLLFVHVLYTHTVYICSASRYSGIAVATNTACHTKLFEFDISYY